MGSRLGVIPTGEPRLPLIRAIISESTASDPIMAILQFRLRATWPNGDTEIKGLYDTLASAERRKGEWEACSSGVRFTVEPTR